MSEAGTSPTATLRLPRQEVGLSCSVLVVSCDAYSDLWSPFFTLFHRHWPDCPFPVYLGTNSKSFDDGSVAVVRSPAQATWSESLRTFLNQIESEYVILLLEDFFLSAGVRNEEILSLLTILDGLGGTVLRLFPRPGPDKALQGVDNVGRIDREAPYRVSTQPAIWRRESLLGLLNDRESAWEFEWNGTDRSVRHSDRFYADGFYATYKPVLTYEHVVERGVWFWTAARRYRREHIGCDFEARTVMAAHTQMRKKLNCFRKNMSDAILPLRWRRRR